MAYTKKPEMIFFDVGGTLFKDGPFYPLEGFKGLVQCSENGCPEDAERMLKCFNEIYEEVHPFYRSRSGITADIYLPGLLKYIFMKCGLKFSLSMPELEEVFDRYDTSREIMPGIVDLLNYLDAAGIRTAVISNNMVTGNGLALSISRWLPEAKMEFVLTSADLIVAKPWRGLFEAAAAYAGVDPADCWYCGDGLIPDVDGARNGGMTPVLIDPASEAPVEYRTDGGRAEYLTVRHWDELVKILKTL